MNIEEIVAGNIDGIPKTFIDTLHGLRYGFAGDYANYFSGIIMNYEFLVEEGSDECDKHEVVASINYVKTYEDYLRIKVSMYNSNSRNVQKADEDTVIENLYRRNKKRKKIDRIISGIMSFSEKSFEEIEHEKLHSLVLKGMELVYGSKKHPKYKTAENIFRRHGEVIRNG